MGKYTATVIKTGNSYALRVPKAYVEAGDLKLGQKVELREPEVPAQTYNPEAVRAAIRNLASVHTYDDITDVVAWQRELRQDRPLPGRE